MIETVKFEVAEKGTGRKGGYRFEYLNGYLPPVPEKKKKKNPIWIIFFAIVVIVILIVLFL